MIKKVCRSLNASEFQENGLWGERRRG